MPGPFDRAAGHLGSLAGVVRQPHPDAELIQICLESVLLEAEYRRRIQIAGPDPDDNDPAALAADKEAKVQWHKLERIGSIPAKTPEGLRAKAEAVHAFFEPGYPEHGTAAGRALWSLVCDAAEKGVAA